MVPLWASLPSVSDGHPSAPVSSQSCPLVPSQGMPPTGGGLGAQLTHWCQPAWLRPLQASSGALRPTLTLPVYPSVGLPDHSGPFPWTLLDLTPGNAGEGWVWPNWSKGWGCCQLSLQRPDAASARKSP